MGHSNTNAPRDRRPAPCTVLTHNDVQKLKLFYAALDQEERQQRFGCAVSGQAIAQHCDGIDWDHSIIVARAGKYLLRAVLEIHPLSHQGHQAEIAIACEATRERLEVCAQLLQVGTFCAASRGCTALVMPVDSMFAKLAPLLRDMGQIRIEQGWAIADIREYADAHRRSDLPATR